MYVSSIKHFQKNFVFIEKGITFFFFFNKLLYNLSNLSWNLRFHSSLLYLFKKSVIKFEWNQRKLKGSKVSNYIKLNFRWKKRFLLYAYWVLVKINFTNNVTRNINRNRYKQLCNVKISHNIASWNVKIRKFDDELKRRI